MKKNPQNVEKGKCTNSTLYGGDPCFAFANRLDLKAGEEKEVNIFLGTGYDGGCSKSKCTSLQRKEFR